MFNKSIWSLIMIYQEKKKLIFIESVEVVDSEERGLPLIWLCQLIF